MSTIQTRGSETAKSTRNVYSGGWHLGGLRSAVSGDDQDGKKAVQLTWGCNNPGDVSVGDPATFGEALSLVSTIDKARLREVMKQTGWRGAVGTKFDARTLTTVMIHLKLKPARAPFGASNDMIGTAAAEDVEAETMMLAILEDPEAEKGADVLELAKMAGSVESEGSKPPATAAISGKGGKGSKG